MNTPKEGSFVNPLVGSFLDKNWRTFLRNLSSGEREKDLISALNFLNERGLREIGCSILDKYNKKAGYFQYINELWRRASLIAGSIDFGKSDSLALVVMFHASSLLGRFISDGEVGRFIDSFQEDFKYRIDLPVYLDSILFLNEYTLLTWPEIQAFYSFDLFLNKRNTELEQVMQQNLLANVFARALSDLFKVEVSKNIDFKRMNRQYSSRKEMGQAFDMISSMYNEMKQDFIEDV